MVRNDAAGAAASANDTVFYYEMFIKIKDTSLAFCEVYEVPRADAQRVIDAHLRLQEADRAFELREAERNPNSVGGKDRFDRWCNEVGGISNAYFDLLRSLKWSQLAGPEYPDNSLLEKEQMAAFVPAKEYLKQMKEKVGSEVQTAGNKVFMR